MKTIIGEDRLPQRRQGKTLAGERDQTSPSLLISLASKSHQPSTWQDENKLEGRLLAHSYNDRWSPIVHVVEFPVSPDENRLVRSRIVFTLSLGTPIYNCHYDTNQKHCEQKQLIFLLIQSKGFLVKSKVEMAINRIALGRTAEFGQADALKAALAEFISVLIFVFAGEGSGMAFNKLTDSASTTPAGLVAAALAHAFALFVAVSIAANISGGHVNPAVTFGAFIGGHITFVRTILYWIAQLIGAVIACLLLKLATGGMETSAFSLSSGVGVWNAVVLEIVITFGLVYTVYATAVDPKKGSIGTIAPIAIGFIVGANILVAGAFDGASMNPAVSFGPAVVSWTWDNHWVYWLGPFIGAAIAAVVYELIFIAPDTHEQLPTTDY
ncbi:hypothetical protein C1H46_029907 [Malus baccata]|uniref:Tonoplast intrinsic protein n=1 Tax=Malus baccata TaxID=106549 RepID=A0A540LDT6_MALBA|nr:hypothetical protein C1H46_029907 [Malus baccata]